MFRMMATRTGKMRPTGIVVGASAVAVVLAAAPTVAQPTGGTVVESPAPALLPPEKQKLIREQARRADLPKAELGESARIGMIIPRRSSSWRCRRT
jgi:hypothetical protein